MDGRPRMLAVAMVAVSAVACADQRESAPAPSVEAPVSETDAFARATRERFRMSATGPTMPDSRVERFERDGATLRAVLPATSPRTTARGARVELAVRACDPFTVTDESSGVSMEITPSDATDAAADVGDGYVVYRGGPAGGADALHRVTAEGTEDYVVFDRAPAEAQVSYVVSPKGVAGLRLVADTLELLDAGGAPRLRLAPPWLVDASGARHDAHVELEGCAADTNPAAPWGRPVTPAGASSCRVRVRWDAAAVAYPALLDPAWTATGSMGVGRKRHTASLLGNGKVLVVGGQDTFDQPLASTELFDPATGTWSAGQPVPIARARHAAATLLDGRVLVTGGTSPAAVSAVIYQPASGTWSTASSMGNSREGHTATTLLNGFVLCTSNANAERYDPTANAWQQTAPLASYQPAEFAASRLNDGRVLVTGGQYTTAASLYDPVADAWSASAAMSVARAGHKSVLLPDGRILVVGGDTQPSGFSTTSEIWNPTTGTWTSAAATSAGHALHQMVLLTSGRVLVAGGDSAPASELYDPAVNAWQLAGPLVQPRKLHTGTALADGRVLLAGGDSGGFALTSAEVFEQLAQGTPCTAPGECTSGFCSDGVCCNTPCTALCQACSAAKKGSGADGACGPIASGSDPDGDCAQQSMSTCDTDGSCNGAGACRLWAPGTVCVAQSCASATSQAESDLCNGLGTCVDKGTTACQPGYLCVGTACATSCSSDAQCTASYYCSGAACVPDQPDGGACTSASQCQSGFCVDGVCCESACSGACQACSQAKTGDPDGLCSGVAADTDPDAECGACSLCSGFGACLAVPADTDPKNACNPGPGFPASCGPDGMCDGAGACRVFAPPTVACGASSCQSGSVAGQLCNGAGQCLDSPPVSCAPYLCSGDQCGNVCSTDADCAAGAYCTPQGGCAPKKPGGTGCAMANECLTAFCADQVCCNGACKGQCEACDAAPNAGSCSPIVGEPHPGHTPCTGEGSVCGGSCDGVDAAACSYPGGSEPCGSSCADSVETKSSCDDKGGCVPGAPLQCDYVCDGDLCKTSCAGDGDCAVGYACNSDGKCSPASGATCIDAHTVRAPEGLTTDCAPYRCEGNACLKVCKSVDDCVLPNVCAGGKCQPPPSGGGGDDAGCGCEVAGGGAPTRTWLAVLALTVAAAQRRRGSRDRLETPRPRSAHAGR